MNEENYREDEINFLEYFKTIYNYRFFIIGIISLSLICGIIYNEVTPPSYKASTSFLIPIEERGMSSSLSGYAKLMGVANSSKLSSYLSSLLNSERIKNYVARDLKIVVNKSNIEQIKEELQLRNTKLIELGIDVYRLEVVAKNPDYLIPIINSYLKNLEILNKEMKLVVQKNLVNPLDYPVIPKAPFKPNKKQTLIFTFIGSFFFSVLLSLFIDFFIQNIKCVTNKRV